ncbi:MAG: DUF3467 domain-containing protein [Acidobacteriia bacterium]|nr:DUF3467 domain-containing protein [Terriglobia bacterium]MBZ5678309.1 DUF3467 domain-containing protein [Terriglobia bacterium]
MPESKDVSKTLNIVDSDKPFLIYCNSTTMGMTPWDIRIKFMEVFDVEGNNVLAKNHGTVVMSPGHAKAALEALQSTVKQYEEKFGEIDLTRIHSIIEASKSTS